LLLVVGRIGRAHGVRGEVTVEVRTDSPDERFKIGQILKTDPESNGPLIIESIRNNSGTLLLSFKNFNDRNAVEKLRNTLILAEVDPSQSNTSENDFHISQIVGAKVVDRNGKTLGLVKDVLSLPAQDTLVVDSDGAEVLVPFVKTYVPLVSIEHAEITVENFEELR